MCKDLCEGLPCLFLAVKCGSKLGLSKSQSNSYIFISDDVWCFMLVKISSWRGTGLPDAAMSSNTCEILKWAGLEDGDLELNLGLLDGWQEPKHLSRHLLSSRHCISSEWAGSGSRAGTQTQAQECGLPKCKADLHGRPRVLLCHSQWKEVMCYVHHCNFG